jgi:spermidine/putrescine transport system permease protein
VSAGQALPAVSGSSERAWRERRELLHYAARLSPLVLFTLAFFLTPFVTLFLYSLGESTFIKLSFGTSPENYLDAITNSLYRELIGRALLIGVLTGVICVVLSYPFAYAITLGPLRRRGEWFLFAILATLFSSYVVRVYAWRTLLGSEGIVNEGLRLLGLEPVKLLLFSRFSLVLTLVNVLIPLAVLPIYSALTQVDRSLIESARDLGATPWQALRKIVIPLSMRGVNAAFVLCFIIAAGDYVTPQLVGGANGQLIGNVISDQFGVAFNWPLGSALAFSLVFMMGVVIVLWLALTRVLGLSRPRR